MPYSKQNHQHILQNNKNITFPQPPHILNIIYFIPLSLSRKRVWWFFIATVSKSRQLLPSTHSPFLHYSEHPSHNSLPPSKQTQMLLLLPILMKVFRYSFFFFSNKYPPLTYSLQEHWLTFRIPLLKILLTGSQTTIQELDKIQYLSCPWFSFSLPWPIYPWSDICSKCCTNASSCICFIFHRKSSILLHIKQFL